MARLTKKMKEEICDILEIKAAKSHDEELALLNEAYEEERKAVYEELFYALNRDYYGRSKEITDFMLKHPELFSSTDRVYVDFPDQKEFLKELPLLKEKADNAYHYFSVNPDPPVPKGAGDNWSPTIKPLPGATIWENLEKYEKTRKAVDKAVDAQQLSRRQVREEMERYLANFTTTKRLIEAFPQVLSIYNFPLEAKRHLMPVQASESLISFLNLQHGIELTNPLEE